MKAASPYALRIEAQAYDLGVGSRNGDGIDHVNFTITDPAGAVILNHDETMPAYCAFGGDSPCEQSISYGSYAPGEYQSHRHRLRQERPHSSSLGLFHAKLRRQHTGG